jgi:CheY-like chemotaxis protein/MinD-like ATPase involved in chromosome partitioning or flagellar assembly
MSAKILLVDDEPDLLRMVGYNLHREGYTVSIAQSGAEALEKVSAEIPDLIILDVMMPDMDGYEVCRQVRATPATETTLIIMLSAMGQIGDKVAGLEAGADDYLTKPVELPELTARVKAMLARARRLHSVAEAEPGKVLGLIGVKGGMGTTTVTLSLAASLAKLGNTVLAAEMRGYYGSFAAQLLLQSTHTIVPLLEMPPEKITKKEIASCLVELAFGPQALLSPGPNGQVLQFSAEHAEAILSIMPTMAQYILLDLPSCPSPAIETAVRYCNYILLVLEAESSAIYAGQAMLNLLSNWGIGMRQIGAVIVNRVPFAIPLKPAQIRESLGCDIMGFIPPMAEACVSASSRGLPLVLAQPDSFGGQNLMDMAKRATADYIQPMEM